MGKVGTGFSMSLDGFVADLNHDVGPLFNWMSLGQTDMTFTTGDHDIDLKVSPESVEMFEDAIQSYGVLVAGRKLFDVAGAWGGKHPMNIPMVVVTSNPPQEWVYEGSPFTFVTDGVESAIAKAKAMAGDKNVVIASTKVLQQAIRSGLVDHIHVDLVPYLLGDGIRMFEHLGAAAPFELEIVSVVQAPGVTHLTYNVVKE